MFGIKIKNGFTLVELLIVIGILGVLAGVLIATIQPFEQIKKSQDSIIKNGVIEYTDANIRYFTTHNKMPWTASPTCLNEIGTGNTLNNTPTCVAELVNDGELKQGFINATNVVSKINVSTCGLTPIICFNPTSLSQNHDPNTRYDQFGNIKPGCPVTSGVSLGCYWCSSQSSCVNNGGDTGGTGDGSGTFVASSSPSLTPTPTPTSYPDIGYCQVRDFYTSITGNPLTTPDLGGGYARVRKQNANTIASLRADCVTTDFQALMNSYCTINNRSAAWEVVVFRYNLFGLNPGNYSVYQSGGWGWPSPLTIRDCASMPGATLTPTIVASGSGQ